MTDGGKRGENFFNTVQKPFPDIVDGKIDTENFLEAANGTVSLLDQWGRIFYPMAKDLSGNVTKLRNVYLCDKSKNATLNDMLIMERIEGGKKVAIEALIWYTRGIHYMELILNNFLEIDESDSPDNNIKEVLYNAYTIALKPYHKWLTQQATCMMIRATGAFISRDSLSKALNTSSDKDEFKKDYTAFIHNLHTIRSEIQRFITQENLDDKTPV